MPSLLQQLENNEAILLMYLADELPEDDRLEVEGLLQTDANLAGELERLRAVHERVQREIEALDRAQRLPPAPIALRRVRQEMAQWVSQRQREAAEIEQRRRRFPWWGYPIAAAAMVGLVLLIWWGALPADPSVLEPPGLPGFVELPPTESFAEDPDALAAAELLEDGLLPDEMASLRQTEQDLRTLQLLTLDLAALDEEGSL